MTLSARMRGMTLLSGLLLAPGCAKSSNDKGANRQLAPLSNISGTLTVALTGTPVSGARVTLFTPDLASFRETRSDGTGTYTFPGASPGSYQLGAAARGWKYEEVTVDATLGNTQQALRLSPESEIA